MTIVTWNPNDKASGITLSNGNLTTVSTGYGGVRATLSRNTGRWYFEVSITSYSLGVIIGIANESEAIGSFAGSTKNGIGMNSHNGVIYNNGATTTALSSYGLNDTIGIAFDIDKGILSFYKNGLLLADLNYDLKAIGNIFPMVSGGNSTGTRTMVTNFGATPFKHPIPLGYYSYDGSQYSSTNKILLSSSDNRSKTIPVRALQEAIPAMTSNTSPTGAVTTSGFISGSEPYKAFDGIIGSGWAVASARPSGGHWIKYDFGLNNEKMISKISLKSFHRNIGGAMRAGIREFELYGSNNNVKFELLLKSSHPYDISTVEYEVENSEKYRYYRLTVPTGHDSNYVHIDEMKLLEYENYKIVDSSSQSESLFINHGMSPEHFSSIDMSSEFAEKHYVQDQTSLLGGGKVFKHDLDMSKITKKLSVI